MATLLTLVGSQRYVHFVGRKAMLKHIVEKSKPHATTKIFFFKEE